MFEYSHFLSIITYHLIEMNPFLLLIYQAVSTIVTEYCFGIKPLKPNTSVHFRFTVTLLGLWVSPVEIGISVIAIAITCGIHDAIGLCFGVLRAKQAAKLCPIVALRCI